MSKHEKDGLMDCLFSGQDMKLDNIKFCRGGADVIGEGELRSEVHSAIVQKLAKSARFSREATRSTQPVIDVREFVANI